MSSAGTTVRRPAVWFRVNVLTLNPKPFGDGGSRMEDSGFGIVWVSNVL